MLGTGLLLFCRPAIRVGHSAVPVVQAECEELSGRVDHLNKENVALRGELVRLSEQCAQLASDNRTLQVSTH